MMPTLPASLTRVPDAIRRAWLARPARERRLLLTAGVLLATLLLATLVDATLATRERLARQLPQARAELERMRADAAELARLRATPAPPPARHAGLGDTVVAAARARGLALDATPSADGLQLRGKGRLPALIDWLAALQAEHRLRPLRLDAAADGSIALLLELPDDGAR